MKEPITSWQSRCITAAAKQSVLSVCERNWTLFTALFTALLPVIQSLRQTIRSDVRLNRSFEPIIFGEIVEPVH